VCGTDLPTAEVAQDTVPPPQPPAEEQTWVKIEEIAAPPPPPVALPAVREQLPVLKCPNCGAPPKEFIEGACFKCGAQAVFELRDDFFVKVSPRVALRSNLGGHGHDRNEDSGTAGCVTIGDTRIIAHAVVTDGVSTCKNPPEASEVAATAAGAVLTDAAKSNEPASRELLARAFDAAWHAVEKVEPELRAKSTYSNPATTIVAAYVVDGEDPWIGWCGDSPAYGIYRTDTGFVAKKLVVEHTVLNEMLEEMDADKPEGEARPVETLAQQIARAEHYLGEKYKHAFEAGDEPTMKELEKDVKVTDAAAGVVEFVSMHTMVECLTKLPEGDSIRPSFACVPRENLVALLLCSDGVGNDVHPDDSIDAPKLAEMYAACNGDALTFADAAVAASSGTDNDTAAVILIPLAQPAPVEVPAEVIGDADTKATTDVAPAPTAPAKVPAEDAGDADTEANTIPLEQLVPASDEAEGVDEADTTADTTTKPLAPTAPAVVPAGGADRDAAPTID
jgi:serine/threonine protein phosphatase PrpC